MSALSKSGQWKRDHPEARQRYNQRDMATRGAERWYQPCPECGGQMTWGAERCMGCRHELEAEEASRLLENRATRVVEMWAAGAKRGEIAAELGLSSESASVLVSELRAAGYDLPYRRPDAVAHGRAIGSRAR